MALTPAILAAALLAHLPSMSFDDHATPDEAFVLEDVDLSIVLYDHVSCEAPEVWLTFETAAADDEVFVQLGVPVIDRLADYRPAVALLAPGLPAIELPFAIPPGVGGVRFDAVDTPEPADFYEPITMTSSWIWYEGTVTVPEAGQGFVVAWDPSGQTGKLWVAIGTVEDFSGGIGVTFEEIWTYHETNGYEPEGEVVEEPCEDPGGETGGETEGGGETDAGEDSDGGESGDTSGESGDTGGPAGDAQLEGCACSSEGGQPSRGALATILGLGLLGWSLRRRS